MICIDTIQNNTILTSLSVPTSRTTGRHAVGLTPPIAVYRASFPVGIPIPHAPRSPRPRILSPSVTTIAYQQNNTRNIVSSSNSIISVKQKNKSARYVVEENHIISNHYALKPNAIPKLLWKTPLTQVFGKQIIYWSRLHTLQWSETTAFLSRIVIGSMCVSGPATGDSFSLLCLVLLID